MSRAVPALLVLALAAAPALAGCGGDDGGPQGAATTPPATTAPAATAPATPSAPTTTSPVPATPAPDDGATTSPDDTRTLEAPGTDPPPRSPTITEVQRPARAVRCPGGGAKGGGEEGDFDARELLGLPVARATALAERNGCAMRVVVRDGQDLIRTMDYSSGRVNVTETAGRVVALNGIG
ncbi:unannotated protein [freshwater metagenome]|uniref:Unannotated protein n=1 Tax=freshwater metagenome TaxID=449393 RepID=A0A6J7HGL9_9ZZZZ|nr:hypothetical protein [Actinomycetota bacterium]